MTAVVSKAEGAECWNCPLWAKPWILETASGCWEWQRAKDTGGYGLVWHEKRLWKAHRLMRESVVGPIPKGMMVCHSCDNPACIHPDHLFIGTAQDNLKDMYTKGRRNSKGEQHHQHTITEDDVREIRRRYAAGGITRKELAREYPISLSTLHKIIARTRWTHVQ